jgi:hypothetical protein
MIRIARLGDVQDVGAEFGERSPRHRAADNVRAIEHTDAG